MVPKTLSNANINPNFEVTILMKMNLIVEQHSSLRVTEVVSPLEEPDQLPQPLRIKGQLVAMVVRRCNSKPIHTVLLQWLVMEGLTTWLQVMVVQQGLLEHRDLRDKEVPDQLVR
jgi:hypothetical protein